MLTDEELEPDWFPELEPEHAEAVRHAAVAPGQPAQPRQQLQREHAGLGEVGHHAHLQSVDICRYSVHI